MQWIFDSDCDGFIDEQAKRSSTFIDCKMEKGHLVIGQREQAITHTLRSELDRAGTDPLANDALASVLISSDNEAFASTYRSVRTSGNPYSNQATRKEQRPHSPAMKAIGRQDSASSPHPSTQPMTLLEGI